MANVVRLCGMTHSMMGTVLKTLNQAASETQRLCYRRREDGDPQNSEKREHGAMGSVGKESACNAGDPSSIPESGRSAGEGIDYPLQYSWASLMAQLVKNLPAMWETWV